MSGGAAPSAALVPRLVRIRRVAVLAPCCFRLQTSDFRRSQVATAAVTLAVMDAYMLRKCTDE
eukprot:scaffold74122_cov22-Prasinocladus_malaysianus.AAC.1